MKTIENKLTTVVLRNEPSNKEGAPLTYTPVYATYGDLLLLTINMAPEQGFSITDIKNRLRLAEAINSANGEIKLEDADAVTLKAAFDKFKWKIISADIVKLSDTLNSL